MLSGERMDSLFSTHPATENRVAALMQMANGGSAPAGAAPSVAVPRVGRTGPRTDRRGPWG